MTQEQIAKRKETEELILKEIKAQFGEIDNASLYNNVYAISQVLMKITIWNCFQQPLTYLTTYLNRDKPFSYSVFNVQEANN